MRNDIAILHYGLGARYWLSIENHAPLYYGLLVVLGWPVTELASENVENFSSPPSFLAECVVCEVIGFYFA
jgi:hypothetical protein